jgi:hypothetical protein
MDVVIPIVFPDYRIAVNTPNFTIDILPRVDFDNLTIPPTNNRVAELGHAGVLFIDGTTGTTKYFEYGRYDKLGLGLVRRITISDVSVEKNHVVPKSLKRPLQEIAKRAGQGGRITGVYIEVEGKFKDMLSYAKLQQQQNANPKRRSYDLIKNSCIHFVKDVVEVAGIEAPWMVDPRPNSYIGEFRDEFPDLDYVLKTDSLKIEGVGNW